MSGLYLHVPFCASRCIYCGFYSTVHPKGHIGINIQERYISALCTELNLRRNYLANESLSTIYLGGGTPSQLLPSQLERIFYNIYEVYGCRFDDMEITMECNPDDITIGFANSLKALPVNRISMGAQTFSDQRLQFLRRRHTSADVRRAISLLRTVAGIDNISLDLMFGFPSETLEEWRDDVDTALSLEVEHISAYSLMFEEDTPLYRMLERGETSEIDDELYRRMYNLLIDNLTAAGYEHYEISNFAQPHRRSRHNSSYWSGVPYIGIGTAAHSFDTNSRQWNVADINQYISALENNRLPIEGREELDAKLQYNDLITTALRTSEGIDLTKLSPANRDYLLTCAEPHIHSRRLALGNNSLTLTREGIYISDSIMADLMAV